MELEEAIEYLKKFCEYDDNLFLQDEKLYEYQDAIETVLQELKNSIPKKKVKKLKSEYEKKYKKHKTVTDEHFKEIGTRDCFDKELAIRDLGAIRVCEKLLEEK